MSKLTTPLDNPVDVLSKEAAAMRQAAEELSGQIATAEVQKGRLLVMALAFENEVCRLLTEAGQQLEFAFVQEHLN
jgi:hypothetical protein